MFSFIMMYFKSVNLNMGFHVLDLQMICSNTGSKLIFVISPFQSPVISSPQENSASDID